jgi:hypothetical protein
MVSKNVHNLKIQDFRTNPIWIPVDDFEDPELEVKPYEGDLLDLEEIYLVAANFKLADDSTFEGYIRFSWGKPKELAISDKDFYYLFIGETDKSGNRNNKFAEKLNKKVDDVFPIEFETSIHFRLKGNAY